VPRRRAPLQCIVDSCVALSRTDRHYVQEEEEEEADEEEEEEEEEDKPKKKGSGKKSGGFGKNYLKPSLANFMGVDSCGRSEVVKEIWRHTKEHDLQDPNDKRWIICDERLTALFGKKKIHMFKMNKDLTKHFGEKVGNEREASEGDDSGGSADEGGSSKRKAKRKFNTRL